MTAKQYREATQRPRFELGWREYRLIMICIALAGLALRVMLWRH